VDEIEIWGKFDSDETARAVAKALNAWFAWVMDGDVEDVPELFEDFGVSTDDYALDRESDIDWPEQPRARARGSRVQVVAETSETVDTLSELMESLGAFDVSNELEEDDED
jgi:hypothetical protein